MHHNQRVYLLERSLLNATVLAALVRIEAPSERQVRRIHTVHDGPRMGLHVLRGLPMLVDRLVNGLPVHVRIMALREAVPHLATGPSALDGFSIDHAANKIVAAGPAMAVR